jgi:hypothetical protein
VFLRRAAARDASPTRWSSSGVPLIFHFAVDGAAAAAVRPCWSGIGVPGSTEACAKPVPSPRAPKLMSSCPAGIGRKMLLVGTHVVQMM